MRSYLHMNFLWYRYIDNLGSHHKTRDLSEFLLVTLTQPEGIKEVIPSASGTVKLGKVDTHQAGTLQMRLSPLEVSTY